LKEKKKNIEGIKKVSVLDEEMTQREGDFGDKSKYL